MRKRTRARELALQILYQVDLRGAEILDDIDGIMERSGKAPDVTDFARDLVVGTAGMRDEADELIASVAEHWPRSIGMFCAWPSSKCGSGPTFPRR